MDLWFNRKKKIDKQLEYNIVKLKNDIQNLSDKLYEFRGEVSWQIIREVIDLAKNIQILEVNLAKNGMEHHKGRLQALSDIGSYIDNAIMFKQNKETKNNTVRGSFNQPRRVSNQAGPSI